MRFTALMIASLAVAACAVETTDPITPRLLRSGSLRYEATTMDGQSLLLGQLTLEIHADSTILGTWTIQWAPGADTTVEVGDQIGSGMLSGRQSENQASIDLNPGFADNNVVLVAPSVNQELAGTWYWSTIAGSRTQGLFTAVPD